ncbi:hypothetical protein [Saccharomonospora sp. NB11]|uniref:hypothetical protein n=1 Tax=Saccharomonospora sp. NB11 TaxID=1642298 RepID=UPI0018D1EC78|nr:hypothetical protein [Saccharomonospora sp. NB11]
MNSFLETLAGKLAERWLTLLVLPGALYLVIATVAVRLGHAHWYRLDLVRDDLVRIADDPAARSAVTLALAVAALLAATAVLGILAQAFGTMFGRAWFASARNPLTRALTRRRARRWDKADRRFREAVVAAGKAQLSGDSTATTELVRQAEERAAVRKAVGLVRPTRPFAAGDRMAAADRRVLDRYGLDLSSTWPRLWLVVPDHTRSALRAAHDAVSSAQRLAGWASAYLLLAVLWWPAAVFGGGALVVAWRRAISGTNTLADLVEAAVDVHGRTLARTLGLRAVGPLDRDVGAAVTALLRKGS